MEMFILAVTIAAAIIGIVAGVVQVLDYVQKRRAEHTQAAVTNSAPPIITINDEAPPHNLPPHGEFVGRGEEKARVLEALASRWPLTCIDGIGGIGKTSLALEVAYTCLGARANMLDQGTPTCEGIVWVSAKDRAITLDDLLDTTARTLGYPGVTQQPLDEKRESIRKILQEKHYLLIVDNFETITDTQIYEYLLRLPEPSKALITSRVQSIPQAWAVSLKGLGKAEGMELILTEAHRLGLTSVEEASEPLRMRLYEATGGAPLAIRWAIGQMKQKGQSLDTVLDSLYGATGNIFATIFARSWDLLSENGRVALMILPLFSTSVDRSAIEAASDLHRWELEEAIGELYQIRLIDSNNEIETTKQRYSIHPLTRAYALARLHSQPEREQQARQRVVHYYVNEFQESDEWYGRASVGRGQFDWLNSELANVFSVIDLCFKAQMWGAVIAIAGPIMYFLGTRGYWAERMSYATKGVTAAARLADSDSEAIFEINIAWVYQKQGAIEAAREHALRAEQLAVQAGNASVQRGAYSILSGLARTSNNLPEAKRYAELSLQIAQQQNQEFWCYGSVCLMADNALAENDLVRAEALYKEALSGAIRQNSQERIAGRHIDLGTVYLIKSDVGAAREHFSRAIEISEQVQREDRLAKARLGMARTEEMAGNYEIALTLAKCAQNTFVRLAMIPQVQECEAMVVRLQAKTGGV